MLESLKKPHTVQLVDRIAFTTGVIISHVTLYLVSLHPDLFPQWYTMLVFPVRLRLFEFWNKLVMNFLKYSNCSFLLQLMAVRYIMYRNANVQFFMLDYCYYAQVLSLATLWLFPTSRVLFLIAFVAANGPLTWAVLAWKNSLVSFSWLLKRPNW